MLATLSVGSRGRVIGGSVAPQYPPAGSDRWCRSTPDDHLTVGPDSCMTRSSSGFVSNAGRRPIIGRSSYLPRCSKGGWCYPCNSRPHDRCSAGPRPCGGIRHLARWSWWSPSSCPCWDVMPARVVIAAVYPPRRSFRSQPTRRVTSRAMGAAVVLVAVQVSVLDCTCRRCSKAGVRMSAPDDHFALSPHCCRTIGRPVRSRCW